MLDFHSRLDGTGYTLTVLTFQTPCSYPIIFMDPKINKAFGTDVFSYLVLSFVITGTEHYILTKSLKIKQLTF